MAREIVGKGVPAEVAALASVDAIAHVLWEDQFNDACHGHDERNFPACTAPC
ncbi:hypothetical protein [Lentzea sp. NPDC004782]|uniref:hypothetical protein n=1 Tax=Lentzea sp. NPDC004782 TaxID=3154458 RepID=UPI0033A831DB